MIRELVIISLSTFLIGACQSNNNKEHQTETISENNTVDSQRAIMDSTKQVKEDKQNKTGKNKNKIKPDTINFKRFWKDAPTNIKLIKTGKFATEDIPENAEKLEWYGIFNNKNSYKIKRTQVKVKVVKDELRGKAKVVTVPDTLEPLFLISQLKNFTPGDLKHIDLEKRRMAPNDSLQFTFNNYNYKLKAYGKKKTIRNERVTKNYFIEIINTETEEKQSQIISGRKKTMTNIGYFKFEFLGDIDKDGAIDFIMDLTPGEVGKIYGLFLSSKTSDDKKLVKKVAQWNVKGC